MPQSERPRKPSSPLGHIVFPGKGKPYQVIETLPDSSDDLESAIVRKFIGALKHFENRELCDLQRGNVWPDFRCKERGQIIGIEIVEVVNQVHAKNRHIQDRYLKRIRELIDDVYACLAGLRIDLIDGYQQPPYPSLTTKAGRLLSQFIADNLKAEIENLERLQGLCVRRWQKGPTVPEAGAFIRRTAPLSSGSPAVLRFQGTFSDRLNIVENLLKSAIEGKINKNYPELSEGKLWLLAYEVFGVSVVPRPSTALDLAEKLLQSREHPFDEVWYIFPYAQQTLGHIEKVWP